MISALANSRLIHVATSVRASGADKRLWASVFETTFDGWAEFFVVTFGLSNSFGEVLLATEFFLAFLEI